MAKTLQLTQKELQQLIIETYKELTDKNFVWNSMQKAKYTNWEFLYEQAYIEDDMAYLDPNLSVDTNVKELTRLQKEIDNRVKVAKVKYKDGMNAMESGDDAWWQDKHLWADILAAVLYIAGAVTSAAGVGVLLLAAAIIVDLVNAYWYYEEEDYFMAGLTASFILIPGVTLAYVKALPGFRQGLKGVASVANKIFSMGGDVSLKQIIRKLGKETTEVIAKTLQKNPKILRTAKAGVKEIDKIIKAFDKLIKWLKGYNKGWTDYLVPDYLVDAVIFMRKVMKVLKTTLILVVSVFTEMSLYDPSFAAGILDLTGFSSGADWLRSKPKYGLSLWNAALQKMGNKKGVMTTTPYDCRGTVYTWDEIVETFKVDYPNRDSQSERRIWEKWTEDNWRPRPYDDMHVVVEQWYILQELFKSFPELEKKLSEINPSAMRSCYNFTKLGTSGDKEDKQDWADLIDIISEDKYIQAAENL